MNIEILIMFWVNTKAIQYYEKTVAIDPNHKTAYRNMGNSYFKINNKEKYLEFLKSCSIRRLRNSKLA